MLLALWVMDALGADLGSQVSVEFVTLWSFVASWSSPFTWRRILPAAFKTAGLRVRLVAWHS